MKPWCTQSIPNVPVDRIHTNTNLLLLLSTSKENGAAEKRFDAFSQH